MRIPLKTVVISLIISYSIFAQSDLKVINVETTDLKYDSVSEKIYVSIPNTSVTMANSIAVINPYSGVIENSVFVGDNPGVIAISDDGQYLYVSLDDSGSVRKVDLASFTPGIEFSLGSTYFVDDMEVMPGNPNTIAVTRRVEGFDPSGRGIAIFVDGIQLPNVTSIFDRCNRIEFSDNPDMLYAYNNESSANKFFRIAVDDSGVVVLSSTPGLITEFYTEIEYAGGLIFSNMGEVVQPEELFLLGTFSAPYSESMTPDIEDGKAYFINYYGFVGSFVYISSFNIDTYVPLDTLIINDVGCCPTDLIRWGSNGLAFRTDEGEVYIVRDSLIGLNIYNNNVSENFYLDQNYPNPFNSFTNVRFHNNRRQHISLQLFDITGKLVDILIDEPIDIGLHNFKWSANHLPSGVYILKLKSKHKIHTNKLIYLK